MRASRTRIAVLVAGLALLAGLAYAAGIYYSGTTAATQANSAVSFTNNGSGGDSVAFRATSMVIINDGPNTVHLDLRDTTATTADWPIKSGESFPLTWDARAAGLDGWPGVGLICATGETASVRVYAWRMR